jgi:hypothetical protein
MFGNSPPNFSVCLPSGKPCGRYTHSPTDAAGKVPFSAPKGLSADSTFHVKRPDAMRWILSFSPSSLANVVLRTKASLRRFLAHWV